MKVSLSPELVDATRDIVLDAVSHSFASRVHDQDQTLWGPEAESEASIRLAWARDPSPGFQTIAEVVKLREELANQGVTDFIVCGMGGSSLAPEVMALGSTASLTVLDSTHPDVLHPLVSKDLSKTAVVVSSKSGGTVETDSQRRAFETAFQDQGIDPVGRIIVVTDPGSPLDEASHAAGYRVFHGNPHIGGRFSALSAFGLVPGTLGGVDTDRLLSDAVRVWDQCVQDSKDNPGLVLGAALGALWQSRNKLLLRDFPEQPGLGAWIEQLVAESTGKNKKSLLPVVGSTLDSLADAVSVGPAGSKADIEIEATLGEQFMVWQFAAAFACTLLGVNPFDQPNVESAKVAARALLDNTGENSLPSSPLPGGAIWQSKKTVDVPASFDEVTTTLVGELGSREYLALLVFGGQDTATRWSAVASALEARTHRPVTLGVGPRYLHSTGQLHKGGTPEGVFLVVIEKPSLSIGISGRDFDFTTLLEAQAEGDAAVLAETGQPVWVVWADSPEDSEKLRTALSGKG